MTSLNIKNNLSSLYNRKLEAFLSLCESEIERLFLLHFINFWESSFNYTYEGLVFQFDAPFQQEERRPIITNMEGLGNVPYSINVLFDSSKLVLIPQYDIRLENKSYRLDFLLELRSEEKPTTKICIECDGYDYHHKDVEKVNKDYKRNIELQKLGYYIQRFTGSQINAIKSNHDFQKIMDGLLIMEVPPGDRERYLENEKNRWL